MRDTDAAGITRRNGLRVNRAKAVQWQRDAARRYDAKRQAARNAARLTTRINRPATRNDWPPKVRKMARSRSGGICELCRTEAAVHLHHRKARRHGDHRIVNALHLCAPCHDTAHSLEGTWRRGFRVAAIADPAVVPIQPFTRPAFYLTDDGHYREAA